MLGAQGKATALCLSSGQGALKSLGFSDFLQGGTQRPRTLLGQGAVVEEVVTASFQDENSLSLGKQWRLSAWPQPRRLWMPHLTPALARGWALGPKSNSLRGCLNADLEGAETPLHYHAALQLGLSSLTACPACCSADSRGREVPGPRHTGLRLGC